LLATACKLATGYVSTVCPSADVAKALQMIWLLDVTHACPVIVAV